MIHYHLSDEDFEVEQVDVESEVSEYNEDDDGYDYDDGQPDTYTEYQDLYGGDDWDHGQFDDVM